MVKHHIFNVERSWQKSHHVMGSPHEYIIYSFFHTFDHVWINLNKSGTTHGKTLGNLLTCQKRSGAQWDPPKLDSFVQWQIHPLASNTQFQFYFRSQGHSPRNWKVWLWIEFYGENLTMNSRTHLNWKEIIMGQCNKDYDNLACLNLGVPNL